MTKIHRKEKLPKKIIRQNSILILLNLNEMELLGRVEKVSQSLRIPVDSNDELTGDLFNAMARYGFLRQ